MAKNAISSTAHIREVSGVRNSTDTERLGFRHVMSGGATLNGSSPAEPGTEGGGGSLPLYTLGTPGVGYIGGPMDYEGSNIPAPDFGNSVSSTPIYEGITEITPSGTPGRAFVTGIYMRAVAEVQLPTTFSMSEDEEDLPVGTATQNFVELIPLTSTNPSDDKQIVGLTSIGNVLVPSGVIPYDNGGWPYNYQKFTNSTNLAASPQQGMFAATGGRHNCGPMMRVPPEFQGAEGFDFDLISVGGGKLSILFTTAAGIAMFGFKSADLLAASTAGQSVTAVRLTDRDAGAPLGGDMYNSPVWNFLCHVAGGWFVPGTRTVMTVGSNWVSRVQDPRSTNEIKYKGPGVVDENGDGDYGGFFAFHVANYQNYAHLWNVDHLIEVAKGDRDPFSVEPYEHRPVGPYPFQRSEYRASLFGAAYWDYDLNRAMITSRRGVTSVYGGLPTIGKFKLEGVD